MKILNLNEGQKQELKYQGIDGTNKNKTKC